MKKLGLFLILLFPILCLAQVAPSPTPLIPVPLPTPSGDPSLISTVTGLISLARGFQSLGFYVAIATALKYLVDLSQLSFLGAPLSKIPVKYQLLVRSGVAAVIAVLGFMAAGAPLVTALVAGLGSAAGSGFIHELLADFAPGALPPTSGS